MHRLGHRSRRGHRVRSRRKVDCDWNGGAPVDPRLAVEVLRTDLDARDVFHQQRGSVGIGAQHDVGELIGAGEPAEGLHVELELLIVADRPRADAADGSLDALRADRGNHVRRGQAEAGEPLRIEPDSHRIVHLCEQVRLADARRARDRVQRVDDGVVGDEEGILLAIGAVEHEELQDRRGSLLHPHALLLHLRRQLRQRALHAIIDVDRVDVGIGAMRERNGERVAAVIAAG
ncbi:hypothetical protein ABH992_002242 [Bradyrhizobium yuanmingense]|uniref:Uncharacterized protein n=1 Tax=Bradyrhizobium yuanmingense TaxID=108015 RepID=A0ABV4GD39_9BRAD